VTKAYKHTRDAIINHTAINTQVTDLLYQIPHRPYRNGFLFNTIRSAPDKEESGVTIQSAGPTMTKEYYALILPETKEIV
ncbi:hypothetical protein KA037_04080, partial [Patescibacteria group bacterium]|nr:hypothetical protein [Patescibacteria group bacterium]